MRIRPDPDPYPCFYLYFSIIRAGGGGQLFFFIDAAAFFLFFTVPILFFIKVTNILNLICVLGMAIGLFHVLRIIGIIVDLRNSNFSNIYKGLFKIKKYVGSKFYFFLIFTLAFSPISSPHSGYFNSYLTLPNLE